MRRNAHRKGQWLVSDDYTGITHYASEMQVDYWGNIVAKPLKRNLQEIASPLNDPEPVSFYRGPTYEVVNTADCLRQYYIGNTGIQTIPSLASEVLGYGTLPSDPGLGDMAVGTTFVIR